jgi:hypothetical protein
LTVAFFAAGGLVSAHLTGAFLAGCLALVVVCFVAMMCDLLVARFAGNRCTQRAAGQPGTSSPCDLGDTAFVGAHARDPKSPILVWSICYPVAMNFTADDDEITAVLLPDGKWHDIQEGSFGLASDGPDDPPMFSFTTKGAEVRGPVTSLLAVRIRRPQRALSS